MSQTFRMVRTLIADQEVRISDHGYDELAEDGVLIADIFAGVWDGTVVEDYPDYSKGPCVLVLQKHGEDQPIHVGWGIPMEASSPAVLVTVYRSDPKQWSEDFTERKQ